MFGTCFLELFGFSDCRLRMPDHARQLLGVGVIKIILLFLALD